MILAAVLLGFYLYDATLMEREFSLGKDLFVGLVGGPGEREHLPVDVDGGEVGDVDVSVRDGNRRFIIS